MNILSKALTVVAMTVGFAAAAQAVTVVPISAVGNSNFPGFAASNAIDANPVSDWASFGGGTSAVLSLDLGAVYTLSGASVTDRVTSGGGNGSFVGGTADFTTAFTVRFFSDAAFTSQVGSVVVSGIATPVAPASPAAFLTTLSFAPITARYVTYSVDAANGGNTGLSDIRFATVPEPGTWALLIIGFGMVGVSARRRKAVVAA
jgi:hypothetical protein